MDLRVAEAMNVSTNAACEKAEPERRECIFAEVVSRYLQTPTFALQSVVDRDQVSPLLSLLAPPRLLNFVKSWSDADA